MGTSVGKVGEPISSQKDDFKRLDGRAWTNAFILSAESGFD
jgi:hypothetical protein